jgi:hypothetical protein
LKNLREIILEILQGGLWHTTHPDRFRKILETGAIVPEPNIPESERWKTSKGPDYYPYARCLGGVSLFDFHEFDAEDYGKRCPMSSWYEFVPYRESWAASVWIEINRNQLDNSFIPATTLLKRWKEEEAYQHSIMPYIEAAHIGPLNLSTFVRAFTADKDGMISQDLN